MLQDAVEPNEPGLPFRELVEHSIQGVVVHRGFRPVFANRAFARIFGHADPAAVLALPSIAPFFADSAGAERAMAQALAVGDPNVAIRRACEAVRLDGTRIWVHTMLQAIVWQGCPAVHCLVVDITDERRREERVRRLHTELLDSARLGAMREVAEALTHRLNQPRGAMLNYLNAARRLLRKRAAPDAVVAILARAVAEGERVYAAIAGVEEILGREPQEKTIEDLNALAAGLCERAATEAAPKGIRIAPALDSGVLPVRIFRSQIQQVALNLMIAAMDSQTTSGRCVVTVRTMRRAPDGAALAIAGGDTGTAASFGLEAAVAEAHGGALEAVRDDAGTTLTLVLPLAGASA